MSVFETDDMSEQGKLLSTLARLLDEGTLVTTRQKSLTGLTPENIQAMHIKQESGTMMGKQVLMGRDFADILIRFKYTN
jgi:NADPH:quinone reductase